MILDLVEAEDEYISVYGVVAVFDMSGVGLGHAMQLPPSLIKKWVLSIYHVIINWPQYSISRSVESWECYPSMTKKLEFVNAPFYVNAFLNTFRFFMSEKLKSRIAVSYGAPNAVSPDILPPELGGTGESYAQLAAHWKQYAQQRADWFVADDAFKSKLANDGDAEAALEACWRRRRNGKRREIVTTVS